MLSGTGTPGAAWTWTDWPRSWPWGGGSSHSGQPYRPGRSALAIVLLRSLPAGRLRSRRLREIRPGDAMEPQVDVAGRLPRFLRDGVTVPVEPAHPVIELA